MENMERYGETLRDIESHGDELGYLAYCGVSSRWGCRTMRTYRQVTAEGLWYVGSNSLACRGEVIGLTSMFYLSRMGEYDAQSSIEWIMKVTSVSKHLLT